MREDGMVYIASGEKTLKTVVEVGAPCRSWECGRNLDELGPMIEYLVEKKLLTHPQAEYLHLTYSGYHYTQTLVTMLFSFLFRSIAVPILVAIATTLITLWITDR